MEGEVGKETKARCHADPKERGPAARDPGREEVVMARCDAAIDIRLRRCSICRAGN